MYCKQCGAAMEDSAKFCASCGASQESAVTSQSQKTERWESKSLKVLPIEEAITLQRHEFFGWELMSSQTVDTKDSHLERRNGDLYSVTESTNYVKLTFRRNKNMPHYEELVELEESFYDLEEARESNSDIGEEYKKNKPKDPSWGCAKVAAFLVLIVVLIYQALSSGVLIIRILSILGLIVLGLLYGRNAKKVKKYTKEEEQWKQKYSEAKELAVNQYQEKKGEILRRAEEILSEK